jgi:EpsI family protein
MDPEKSLQSCGEVGMNKQSLSWVRVILAAALLAATALFLHSRTHAEALPPREPLSSFPLQLGNWHGVNVAIPQWALDILGHGEFVERSFNRTQTDPPVDLFVAYFPSQRSGSTIHSPQNCLPGSGWTPMQSVRMEIPRPGGGEIKLNRYVLAKGLNRMLVLYWYESHGRSVASEYWAKFYLIADSIRMNRSDGALIRVSTPINDDETLASAEHRGVSFIDDMLPQLDRFIPR